MARLFLLTSIRSTMISDALRSGNLPSVIQRMTLFVVILALGLSSAPAQEYAQWAPCHVNGAVRSDDGFHRSEAQKGVAVSTDVLLVLVPSAALIGTLCARDWQGLLQGVESAATTAAATLILKYSVREWRPDHSNRHSFPSGHTAVTFASAAFLQRRYGWAYGAPAYALATYVGWGRVFARKHHWWDVLAGAAIGAGSSYIFTRPFAKKHNLKISPVADETSIGIFASMEF